MAIIAKPQNLRALAAGIIWLALMSLYVATSPQGLSWDLGGADGGDLAAAAITRGIAHPPGYPTYILLAQIPLLIPIGTLAYRLNLFSAFCTASTAALIGWVIPHYMIPDSGWNAAKVSILSGLFFGLIEIVWSQGVITEVYALAGLYCALILALTHWIAQSSEEQFGKRLALLSGISGIGLGAHYLVGLMFIFSLTYLLLSSPTRFLRPSNIAALLTSVVGFLVVFAYLPLRAGVVAISDWGRPDTFDRFIWMISVAAYRDRWLLDIVPTRFASLIRVLVGQFSIPGIILSVFGLSLMWDTHRRLVMALLSTLTINLFIVAGYDSLDTLPYLYPSLILLTLGVAVASHEILTHWLPLKIRGSAFGNGVTIVTLVGVLCVPLLVINVPKITAATNDAELYGRAVVGHAPTGSVIISNEDRHTFAIRYALASNPKRFDLIPIDERLLQFDWFREDLATIYPALGLNVQDKKNTQPRDSLQLLSTLPPTIPVVFTYSPYLPTGYVVEPGSDGFTFILVKHPSSEHAQP